MTIRIIENVIDLEKFFGHWHFYHYGIKVFFIIDFFNYMHSNFFKWS